MEVPVTIYTIGYGNRPIEAFIALLHQYEITHLADTRSVPYSRYRPAYRKNTLKTHLETAKIGYEYLGDRLGGRPASPACYTDGQVDYAKIRQQAFFQAGLAHLLELAERQCLAILCAELRPQNCHRTHLIGAALSETGVIVLHVDETGQPLPHRQVAAQKVETQLRLLP
ncbi:MAG: DUF488 family protein [Chloroflexota bacterium]